MTPARILRSLDYRIDRLLRRWISRDALYAWWWWRSWNRPHVQDPAVFRALAALPGGCRGLDLGSGGLRARPDAVTTDIQAVPGVDVAADGGRLPFRPETFDYVWSNAVLEHVRDPFGVAREIVRVLRPGGLAIVHVPFLEFGHGRPHDYFRYTPEGLRVLFAELDEVAAGVGAGPSQVLPDLLQYYAAGFADLARSSILTNLWCVFVGIWLLPLRLLDRLLHRRPGYELWARSYYFIGRKRRLPPESETHDD